MDEKLYRVEFSYRDVSGTRIFCDEFFDSLSAAMDCMSCKIVEYSNQFRFFECFVTFLVGDCPQIACYTQYKR